MRTVSREAKREKFLAMSLKLFEEMEAWYEEHPEATFSELELRLREGRRELMGKLLGILLEGQEQRVVQEAPSCPECGCEMEFHEYRKRTIRGLEGETHFKRGYYRCPSGCDRGVFPPRRETGFGPEESVE